MTNSMGLQKDAEAFRTISEVADALNLPQHVLRFWETRFTQIKPMKRAGGRRFYRPQDIELLGAIRQLLYGDGYTIKGVQRILREQGPKAVAALAGRREGRPAVADGAGAAAPSERVDAELDDTARETGSAAFEALSTAALLRAALDDLSACRILLGGAASR